MFTRAAKALDMGENIHKGNGFKIKLQYRLLYQVLTVIVTTSTPPAALNKGDRG